MKKVAVALAAVAALGGVVGCSTATGQRDQLIKALALAKPEGRETFAVHGDPFCEVSSDLLDSKARVDEAKATKKLKALVVTSASGSVGVVGVAPFVGACKRQVVDAMRTLK